MRLRALTWYGVIFGWLGVTALLGADPVVYAGPNPPFNFRDKGVVQGLGFDLLEASLATIRPRFSQEEIDLDMGNQESPLFHRLAPCPRELDERAKGPLGALV